MFERLLPTLAAWHRPTLPHSSRHPSALPTTLNSSLPPLPHQVALLGEILDAWSYTVRARLGLFAPHDTQLHTHTAGADGDSGAADGGGADGADGHSAGTHAEDAAAAVDAVLAHHQWIAFMWEVRPGACAFAHPAGAGTTGCWHARAAALCAAVTCLPHARRLSLPRC